MIFIALLPSDLTDITSIFVLITQMADRGIVSRFRGREMHCDECIRVTIGTPEENRQFLDMLKRVYVEIAE